MSLLDNKSNSVHENTNKIEKNPHLKNSIKKYGRNLLWALMITASFAWAHSISAQNSKVNSIVEKGKTEIQAERAFCLNLDPKYYTQSYPFVLPEHADSFLFKITMTHNLIKPLPISVNEVTDWKIVSVIDPSGKEMSSDWWTIVIDKIWERKISYQKWSLIKKTKVVLGYGPAVIHDRSKDEEEQRKEEGRPDLIKIDGKHNL